ncbi:MAG: ribbon-helix-helix protein, CopG family [Pseudomonadota bacterium]|nr:ribbon-helix-helix protein, CopG family [Pseudomonadota bacterium]
MAAVKTETITVRIDPAVKAGLKAAAEQEHRSIANMVEVLIRDYCGRNGIEIRDPGTSENTKGGRNR